MKKILSVVLAVMMIFGSFAISASAASEPIWNEGSWNGVIASNQCTIRFDFRGGKPMKSLPVYDSSLGKFVYTTDVPDPYIMYPTSADDLVAGSSYIWLPNAMLSDGSYLKGWEVQIEYAPDGYNQVLASDYMYRIPNGAAGKQITFIAHYNQAVVEEDTLGTILGILTKVFGAIIGILLYGGDTEAGVAMMDKILGGLDL